MFFEIYVLSRTCTPAECVPIAILIAPQTLFTSSSLASYRFYPTPGCVTACLITITIQACLYSYVCVCVCERNKLIAQLRAL